MKKQLSNSVIASLCLELSLMTRAGIAAEESVGILLEEERDPRVRAGLAKIKEQLAIGEPLFTAMAAAEVFPSYLLEMVEIGEKTGNLDKVLHNLALHYDRQAETSRSVKNAVGYPAVLMCMMLFVVIILITQVFPIFEDVYRQLGGVMTGAAAVILRIGTALADNWLVAVIVLAVLIAAAFLAFRVTASRRQMPFALGSRRLRRLILEERFASSMAMTMASGFDVDDALAMSAKLCGDDEMSARIAECRRRMAEGTAFSEAVAEADVLQGHSARLLGVGVLTGTADAVLVDIADRTQQRILDATEAMIGRIEPTLVVVMSVLVGGILMTVMLPLTGILSTLG